MEEEELVKPRFLPLRNFSHYSLLTGLSRPASIVKKCKEEGYTHVGITDICTVSSAVSFIKACKEEGLVPIIGSTINLSTGGSIALICRNKSGWTDLLRLISRCNDPDNYDQVPKISIDQISGLIDTNNFVCIDGYVMSSLFCDLFEDVEAALLASDESSLSYNSEDLSDHVNGMRDIFPHYFVEVDRFTSDSFPCSSVLLDAVQAVDPRILIPASPSYYCNRSDVVDHRILMCINLKCSLKNLESTIHSSNPELNKFIKSSSYYIKDSETINELYSATELSNAWHITELCEDFTILSAPQLPHFDCPDDMSENDYLKQLCRDGWKKHIAKLKLTPEMRQVYGDRVLKELSVIENANLAGYFLIVQDYVNEFRKRGCLVGAGRGSGAGSLVCYLTGITLVDPIPYDLIFERFYSAGRSFPSHVAFEELDFLEYENA
jgi:DNA polymerase III subunit alpha